QNRNLCGSISSNQLSSLCYYNIAGGSNATNSSPTNYTKILQSCKQTGNYSNFCMQSVLIAKAVVTKNTTICKNFPAPTSSQCFISIADKYKNSYYCSLITN